MQDRGGGCGSPARSRYDIHRTEGNQEREAPRSTSGETRSRDARHHALYRVGRGGEVRRICFIQNVGRGSGKGVLPRILNRAKFALF